MTRRTMDPKDPVVKQAVFGEVASNFIRSEMGVYLVKRAEDEVEKAVEELKRVNARDGKAVEDIQNRIWKAESFQQWLADAVIEGAEALKILDGED